MLLNLLALMSALCQLTNEDAIQQPASDFQIHLEGPASIDLSSNELHIAPNVGTSVSFTFGSPNGDSQIQVAGSAKTIVVRSNKEEEAELTLESPRLQLTKNGKVFTFKGGQMIIDKTGHIRGEDLNVWAASSGD